MKTTYGKRFLSMLLVAILAFVCSSVAFAAERTLDDLTLAELESHLEEMEDMHWQMMSTATGGEGDEWWTLYYELEDYIEEVKDAIDETEKAEFNESYGKEVTEYDEMEEYEANMERFRSLSPEEQLRIFKQELEAGLYGGNGETREKKAAQEAAQKAAALAAKPITLVINGVTINTDSPPIAENGRTLAPMRTIVEALGYIVSWDSKTQKMGIYDPETQDLRIALTIGSKAAKVSTGIYGVMDEQILDVPAKVINGRTMVPVRFIAESLGCSVAWNGETKTVSIVSNAG